jgi:hypothetical protein
MSDDNNEYTYAGPGYKRRMQQERSMRASASKPKPIKRERLEPAKQNRPKETAERPEYRDVSATELKRAIRRLTPRTENVREINALLLEEGISASLVTISAVRREFLASSKERVSSTSPPHGEQ